MVRQTSSLLLFAFMPPRACVGSNETSCINDGNDARTESCSNTTAVPPTVLLQRQIYEGRGPARLAPHLQQSRASTISPRELRLQVRLCPDDCEGCWDRNNYPMQCLTPATGFSYANQHRCEWENGRWCPAQVQDVGACSSGGQCSSGICRGGYCCNAKGSSEGCIECWSATNGDCRTCDTGYNGIDYQCEKTPSLTPSPTPSRTQVPCASFTTERTCPTGRCLWKGSSCQAVCPDEYPHFSYSNGLCYSKVAYEGPVPCDDWCSTLDTVGTQKTGAFAVCGYTNPEFGNTDRCCEHGYLQCKDVKTKALDTSNTVPYSLSWMFNPAPTPRRRSRAVLHAPA